MVFRPIANIKFTHKKIISKLLITIVLVLSVLILSCQKSEYNKNAISLNNQAGDLIMKFDYENAIPLLENAIRIDPTYITAYNNLIVIYLSQNNLRLALRTAIELSEISEIKDQIFKFYYAYLLNKKMGNETDAVYYYTKLLEDINTTEIAKANSRTLVSHIYILSFEKEQNQTIFENYLSEINSRNDLTEMEEEVIDSIKNKTSEEIRSSIF